MKLKFSKGQMPLIGAFVALMVAVIVGVAVVLPVIQEQIDATSSTTDYNQSALVPTNGTTTTLSDGDIIAGTVYVVNTTNGETVPVANYTTTLGTQSTPGTIAWYWYGTNTTGDITAGTVNVHYRVYDASYIKNRTVVTLMQIIPLMLALAILIGAVVLIKV